MSSGKVSQLFLRAAFIYQGWEKFTESNEHSGFDFMPKALPLWKDATSDQVPADLKVI